MLFFKLNRDGTPVLVNRIGGCGHVHINERKYKFAAWKNPGKVPETWEEALPPQHILHAERICGPWHLWTRMAQDQVHGQDNLARVHRSLRFPEAFDIRVSMNTDYKNWYINMRGENDPYFDKSLEGYAFRCERCDRLYDDCLRTIEADDCRPIFQFSFPFCPANANGSCKEVATDLWKLRQDRVCAYENAAATNTMAALSGLPPEPIIAAVFSINPNDLNGLDQIWVAYKAFRVLWFKAFTAPATAGPDAAQRGRSVKFDSWRILRYIDRIKNVNLWGDLVYDLGLVREGLISPADLKYVYCMSHEVLEYMVEDINCQHDIHWLNAYIGMRRLVPEAQYVLLKTAVQRAATAMERLLDVKKVHAMLPGSVRVGAKELREYASNGMCFHELHSALCVDLNALRDGSRAVVKRLPESAWRRSIVEIAGKRVCASVVV